MTDGIDPLQLAGAFLHVRKLLAELPDYPERAGSFAALESSERFAEQAKAKWHEALAEKVARSEAPTAPVKPEARRVQGGVETQDRINPWKDPRA